MLTHRVLNLADALEREILQSDLHVGAPHLTTAEAARKFRVNTQTANNALRVLVKRGILVRRRRQGTFILRALPADLEAVKQAVLDVLTDECRPTGLFCRTRLLADGAALAAECLGLQSGRDVEIVLADLYRKPGDPPPSVPSIVTSCTAVEIGHHIGRMLAQQARGEPVVPAQENIPVRLEVPEEYHVLAQEAARGSHSK
ncbi:MAG: GntR family transcriptional regulator [Thermoguttaceae bacterium]